MRIRKRPGPGPRLRLLLLAGVAAAIAASPVHLLAAGSSAARQASTASPAAALGAAATPACSAATARQLVAQNGLNAFLLPDPVAQVLCGPFAGPGSEAMVVAIGPAPTCWPVQRWAVFAFTGGSWQLVLDRGEFVFPPLVAVGGDIRVTTPVFRVGDPRCVPSGGKRARTWHWDGTRLVAGPWTQVAKPLSTIKLGYFKTPSGNIVCAHIPVLASGPGARPQPSVFCGIRSGLRPAPPRRTCAEGANVRDRLILGAAGRTVVPRCWGDEGPFAALHVGAAVLRYGRSWSGGGLRCTSALKGLTCRNRAGHGFFLSRTRFRAF